MIVGLTGGIGSGKSTVAARWREHGAQVVSADAVAREVVQAGSPALAQLVDLLGREILDGAGHLRREQVAARMFSDPQVRRQVEAVLHPAITARVLELLDLCRPGPVVYEAPLLFEAGHEKLVELVVVVAAPRRVRLARACRRDGADRAAVLARMAAQWTDAQRCARADVIIENTGDLPALWAAADAFWEDWISGRTPQPRYPAVSGRPPA